MDLLWTWRGVCFGYRDLRNHDGHHVGRFHDDEISGPDGYYLGEVRSGNRLIRRKAKLNRRKSRFAPRAKRVSYVRYVNYVGS